MNELPIMPIRAKYADETTKGVNIDDAIEGAAGDIGALDNRIENLETTVGDSSAGLVKQVGDLETSVGVLQGKTQAITHTEGVTDVDGKLTGDEIIENMSGYSFIAPVSDADVTINPIFASACKNGNKLTFVLFMSITRAADSQNKAITGTFTIPSEVANKLVPYKVGGSYYLDNRTVEGTQKSDFTRKTLGLDVVKHSTNKLDFTLFNVNFTETEETYVRIEETFLLSDNMIPQP